MIKHIFRSLRGFLGNALAWGSAWFVTGVALAIVFNPFEIGHVFFWPTVKALGRALGGLGFFAGGGFSLYLLMAGRNREISKLRPGWVALGAGITVGLLIPAIGAFYGPAMLLSAIKVGGLAGVLAGGTAFGQIKIAQIALTSAEDGLEALGTGAEQLLTEATAGKAQSTIPLS